MLRRVLFCLVLAVLAGLTRPAEALDAPAAETLVRNAVNDATTSFAGGPFTREQTRAKIAALVEKYADIAFESELILGRYWRKAEPAQKDTFTGLLIPFFVATYGEMMDNAPTKPEVVFLGAEAQQNGGFVVHTQLKPAPDEVVPLDFIIVETPAGRAVISDALADGVGLATTIRSDFTAVIRSAGGNIEVLFDAMRKKIAMPPPVAKPAS